MAENYPQLLHYSPGVEDADAALSLCALGGCPILPNRNTPTIAGVQSSTFVAIIDDSDISAAKRKYTKKPRDPKRDTSVSFQEMNRLMRVYGPIKCLRNRSSKESGKTVKPESIRRKFYRWFPDFNERFVKTSDGWFKPQAGHQQEMRYREELRKKDKELLMAKKKLSRRPQISKEAPVVA
mmetsp:Transcript_34756/g.74030  ORF Transcript_34756/g.74030 Transcript_34756/m.74030 type:complete len:181 (+) Transcript_34756:133-675(+)|eukprot:CAMPEP_0172555074 /NCGR_PEP_ID=MMETSP1067-20121228/57861_1 /TAXON_ID=265564 ORGANISM="Thalassiosira punctigera, Strain Tpunct2005C2" /NCGR_SAMPLE_ID=MMETSP1067 /ASSEMBLY_ACC=CAM_ASM_000444 /LENGTH=180 /DNA_ID=CAMNT_0013343581 /DNA_START=47 /DNA_END=589 /DNA_ORIENTATION=+